MKSRFLFKLIAVVVLFIGEGHANNWAGCTIETKLGFPEWGNPDNAPYFGDHTDWLEVWYEKEYCDSETFPSWCTYINSNDAPGSQGAYISNVNDDWGPDIVQEESIVITAMQGKTIRINVYHWYNSKDYYPKHEEWQDHMLAATLSVKDKFKNVPVTDIYGEDGWTHPVEKAETTHLGDYEVNPEYQDEFSIFVTCDEYCDCIAHDYTITDINTDDADTDADSVEDTDSETPPAPKRSTKGAIAAIAILGSLLFLLPASCYVFREFKKNGEAHVAPNDADDPILDEFSEKLDEFEELRPDTVSQDASKACDNDHSEFENFDGVSYDDQSALVAQAPVDAFGETDNTDDFSNQVQSVVASNASINAVGEIQDIDDFSHQFEHGFNSFSENKYRDFDNIDL